MKIASSHSFYSCAAHDELLGKWANLQHEYGEENFEQLELDLTRSSFVDPYGIVALTLFLNHLPQECLPVRLKLEQFPLAKGAKPPENGVVAYLTRMGFFEEVGAQLDVHSHLLPVRPMWQNDKNVLIDITILHGRDAINVMLRKIGEILGVLGYNPISRGHVMEVLSELSSNVLDHAQADYGGVVATQTYRSRRSGTRYLVMSIGDYGIGIRNSIAGNEKFAGRLENDALALGVAMGQGNSRFATGGRGGGLARVVDIARKYRGSLSVRSGSGAFTFQGKDDTKQTFEAPLQAGTQLRIMLPESGLLS
jgi:hypothetical protein